MVRGDALRERLLVCRDAPTFFTIWELGKCAAFGTALWNHLGARKEKFEGLTVLQSGELVQEIYGVE